jgi:diguanylate cyclase (GGDEF)-like protein
VIPVAQEAFATTKARGDVLMSRRLLETAETIYSSIGSPALATTILAEATRLAGAHQSALLEVRGDVLVAQETLGLSDRCRQRFVLPLEGSPFGRAVLSRTTVTIEDVAAEGPGGLATPCGRELRTALIAPLESQRASYGALALFYDSPRRIAAEAEAVLHTFAIQAAIALDNQRLMHEKEQLAVRDGLTGAYNRGYLELAMERVAKELKRNGGSASILFLDVDAMKEVNDTGGHEAGDRILVDLARLLTQSCRETDVVARYGGDEFVVLMPGTDAEGARQVTRKVDAAVVHHNATVAGPPLSVSMGVHSAGPEGIGDLLREADRRMYATKRSRGRG